MEDSDGLTENENENDKKRPSSPPEEGAAPSLLLLFFVNNPLHCFLGPFNKVNLALLERVVEYDKEIEENFVVDVGGALGSALEPRFPTTTTNQHHFHGVTRI